MSRIGLTSSASIVASPTNASETVICTVSGANPIVDTGALLILYFVQLTIGSAGNALTAKIRRGATVSDTLAFNGNADIVTAGSGRVASGAFVDFPGSGGAFTYSLTVTVGGTAATSTVNSVSLIAIAL